MNGNVIDLAIPFQNRMQILRWINLKMNILFIFINSKINKHKNEHIIYIY
jgi:hypothetical protein